MVLGLVPYGGSVINIVVMTYLLVTASSEVHHLAANKAWTVFGIIGAVIILISISGQMAARKFSGRMRQNDFNFEKNSTRGDSRMDRGTSLAGGGAIPAAPTKAVTDESSALRQAAKRHLEESIARMEAEMANVPAEQQAQIRETLEKMKESRVQMGD